MELVGDNKDKYLIKTQRRYSSMVGVPFYFIWIDNLISEKFVLEEFLEDYSVFGIESYHFFKKILHFLTYHHSV